MPASAGMMSFYYYRHIRVSYCDPGLVPHLCSDLARGPDWVPVIFVPALATVAIAAHAVKRPAAAYDPGIPGLAAEEKRGSGQISEGFRHPAAAAASVDPADQGFSTETLPAFPAEQVRASFVLPAVASAGGQPCHAAGNGNSGCGAYAAALPGGTGLQNTAAGRPAAGRVPVQSCAATGPIRCAVAPIHSPSVGPTGAARSAATRESTREAAGSSSPGYAG